MAGIRIGGMATGMDTEATVKTMMKPYEAKVDKVKQDRQTIQWKQDAYRDTIKTFRGFYNKFLDPLSSDFVMSSKNFSSTSATSSNSLVDVTTLPGAIKGDYTVDVSQTAEAAKFTKNYTSSSEKVGEGTLNIEFQGKALNPPITTTADDTVATLIDKVNIACKDMGITAQYSQVKQEFSIQTIGTGSATTMKIGGTGTLGLAGVTDTYTGKDAKIKITKDGTSYNTTSSSNSVTVDGINIKINGSASETANPPTTISSIVSVKSDAKPAVDKIKAFVSEYNTLVGTINKKLTEKKQYTYKPLTDDQKKDMKDTDIANWEDKCKQGILSGDSMIGNLMQQMRNSLYQGVTGAGITLSEIGISTTSDYQDKAGQLVIDETKLTTALENNSDKVKDLFTKSSNSLDNTTKSNESGIFQRIKTSIYNMTMSSSSSPLLKKSGYLGSNEYNNDLTNNLKGKDLIISQMQKDLTDRESRFYSKMGALEKAMNQSNAQKSWLSQQMGGGA